MNTKEIVWKLFKEWILEVATKYGKKTLDFYEVIHILRVCGEVYDNRTMKNYIECMMSNHWLIPDEDNLLPLLASCTSIYKYKRVKWTINEQATYNGISKDEILSQILS